MLGCHLILQCILFPLGIKIKLCSVFLSPKDSFGPIFSTSSLGFLELLMSSMSGNYVFLW